MHTGFRQLFGIVLCFSAVTGIVQADDLLPPVTDADVERVKRDLAPPTDAQIERAIRGLHQPTEREIAATPAPSTPKLDALPKPATPADVDLRTITKGFEPAVKQALAAGAAMSQTPSLLVFVSFSMPEKTLARLVDQAARSGATLVLRGLTESSLKQTVLRVQQLIGSRKMAFQIDPQSFERFAVDRTPTFVLVRAGAQPVSCGDAQCFRNDAYVSVSGDVSLDYALEFMQRQAPGFNGEAGHFLRGLRG
ncbi:MAG: type-F conjugative transfer system pilin assembly protein TrbC [Candidatus Methylophosphatis roskildensis]